MNISKLEYNVLMQAINNARAEIADGEFIDPFSENANMYSEEELLAALDSAEEKLYQQGFKK